MKLALLRFSLIPVVFCLIAVSARADDPTGTWHWTNTARSGKMSPYTMQLRQRSGSISGTINGPKGTTQVNDGTFSGSTVAFSATFGGGATVRYSGTLYGDTINGTLTFANAGSGGSVTREWIARRDPQSAPQPSS
jgi:hypothetical protein